MADTKKNPKDGLALVVGGLFILALVFATYNYFNKRQSNTGNQGGQTSENGTGSINGEGATDNNALQALGTGGPITTGQKWVATNYKFGDIKGPTYQVKSGDTLWEIAEAVYGNGAQWHQILNANKSSIGFLPNGSQALIVPGQVLVLP
jgi:nucleoid-associated protein YgaU